MLRKLTLALVAAASLSVIALAPTAASAGGGKWGGGGKFGGWHPHHNHHHHGHHGFGLGFVGGGYGGDGCYQPRRIMTPFGPRIRIVNVCAW